MGLRNADPMGKLADVIKGGNASAFLDNVIGIYSTGSPNYVTLTTGQVVEEPAIFGGGTPGNGDTVLCLYIQGGHDVAILSYSDEACVHSTGNVGTFDKVLFGWGGSGGVNDVTFYGGYRLAGETWLYDTSGAPPWPPVVDESLWDPEHRTWTFGLGDVQPYTNYNDQGNRLYAATTGELWTSEDGGVGDDGTVYVAAFLTDTHRNLGFGYQANPWPIPASNNNSSHQHWKDCKIYRVPAGNADWVEIAHIADVRSGVQTSTHLGAFIPVRDGSGDVLFSVSPTLGGVGSNTGTWAISGGSVAKISSDVAISAVTDSVNQAFVTYYDSINQGELQTYPGGLIYSDFLVKAPQWPYPDRVGLAGAHVDGAFLQKASTFKVEGGAITRTQTECRNIGEGSYQRVGLTPDGASVIWADQGGAFGGTIRLVELDT